MVESSQKEGDDCKPPHTSAVQAVEVKEGDAAAFVVLAVIVLNVGAGLEVQVLVTPTAAQLVVEGAGITLAAVDTDTKAPAG